MNIMVVHQYFLGRDEAGGSRWNQFARYLAQEGHKVSVLAGTVHYATGTKDARYKGRFIVREKISPNITVYRCHVSESYNRSFLGRFWAYLSFAFSSTMAGILRAPRPDVVIATSPPLTVALTMWAISVFYGAPAVFEVRDLWPESAIDTGVLASRPLIWFSYKLEDLAYRRSSWINVLTPAFKDFLIAKKGVPSDRISLIPNGADLDIMQSGPRENYVRQELNLQGKFVVSYFGAHGRANRLGQLLDAAEELKGPAPDVKILLVGDGMEKPSLVRDAERRNLNNVIFVDAVPKSRVADYINASDVCTAVLMRSETFKTVYPNKIFDYMSCRRPIIIAIDGAARKLVEDSGAGVFVEPENPKAFAQAVMQMKFSAAGLAEMGENGFQYVSRFYDRKLLSKRYLDVLNRVLKQPGRPPCQDG